MVFWSNVPVISWFLFYLKLKCTEKNILYTKGVDTRTNATALQSFVLFSGFVVICITTAHGQ